MEPSEKLEIRKRELLRELGPNAQIVINVIPEFELIIGPQPPPPVLNSAESRNRFHLVFQNFVRFFRKPEHPLAIFLDDLQWADPGSLELIRLMICDEMAMEHR